VDVCANAEVYQDCDVSFENVYKVKNMDAVIEELHAEGYRIRYKEYTGEPNDHDEAFTWRDLGVPTFSFTIPIQAIGDNWHRIQCDNTISSEIVARAANCLTRTVLHLMD
jgi:hypothetical protein